MRPIVSGIDLKLALRILLRHPALTLVGMLGMTVAIAIGTATFSVVYTLADPALPLPGGERLVLVQNYDVARSDQARETHLHDLETWRAELRAVEWLGAYRTVTRNVVGADGRAEPLRVVEMDAAGFQAAGAAPLLGRVLRAEDARGGAPVAVIGHEVWRERFAGDPEVVGRTLRLDETAHTVVGVMPQGFAFPVNNRVWTPLRLEPSAYERGAAPHLHVFGRLAPGATTQEARAQIAALGRRLAADHPQTHRHLRPQVLPYGAVLETPEMSWVLHLVQLVVTLLLAVIALNVAILVYARTAARAGEIAVRHALGASRARVVVQLFVEALLLAAAAAVLGLGVAALALRQLNGFLQRVAGEQLPFWLAFELTPGTLGYAAGLAVFAAVVVGVLPALKVTGRRMQASLRELGGGTGVQMGRTWTLLIVAQVAVAVTLLPFTLALGWSEIRPRLTSGPAPDQLLTARLALGQTLDPQPQRDRAAVRLADRYAELVRLLEAEPGVAGVTHADHLPGTGASAVLEVEPQRPGQEPARRDVLFLQVGPGLFGAFRAPMLAGQTLRPAEGGGTPTAVVANRSFVERVLGGGDALGRRFR